MDQNSETRSDEPGLPGPPTASAQPAASGDADGRSLPGPSLPSSTSDSNTPNTTDTTSATGESPPSFTARSHRTWTPKYGRVQKCDFCNGRSRGTLHVCTTCTLHICEACARDGRWHSDSQHFIDPDACSWVEKKDKRKPRGGRPQKPSAKTGNCSGPPTPRSKSALTIPNNELLENQGPSPRWSSSTESNKTDPNDGEYIDDEDNLEVPNRATKRIRSAVLPTTRAEPQSVASSLSYTQSGHHAGPTAAGDSGHYTYPPGIPAASDRPDIRQAAARAIARISQLDGSVQSALNIDIRSSSANDEHVNEQIGANNNENDRRGDHAPRMAGLAPENTSFNPIPTSAQPGAPAPHQHQTADQSPDDAALDRALDIYEHMYGHRPQLGYRLRTAIPEHWDGEWPQQQQQRRDNAPSNQTRQIYQSYHQHVFSAMTHLQHPASVPPPPPGYDRYSFRNYPQYPEGTNYTPSMRTTPLYHPYNEFLPAELQLIHNDRLLLGEMQRAWFDAGLLASRDPVGGSGRTPPPPPPHLVELRRAGRHQEALQLLWDVFELRRARAVDLRDFSQTVRWFVYQRTEAMADEFVYRLVKERDGYGGGHGHGQRGGPGPAPGGGGGGGEGAGAGGGAGGGSGGFGGMQPAPMASW